MSQLSLSRGPNAAPDSAPGVNDYLAAVQALADQPEVAIVAAPDLGGHLTSDDDRKAVVSALLSTAASQLDRLVLLDVPPARPAARSIRSALSPGRLRCFPRRRTRCCGVPRPSTTRGCWCPIRSAG